MGKLQTAIAQALIEEKKRAFSVSSLAMEESEVQELEELSVMLFSQYLEMGEDSVRVKYSSLDEGIA